MENNTPDREKTGSDLFMEQNAGDTHDIKRAVNLNNNINNNIANTEIIENAARMENMENTGNPAARSQEKSQTGLKSGLKAGLKARFKKETPDNAIRPKKSTEARKRRRKRIRIAVILIIIAIFIIFAVRRFTGNSGEDDTMILTDFVRYGAITAKVEGNGVTRAKNSETMMTPAAGTVREILVEEGDAVSAGDLLYVMESESARQAVSDAEDGVQAARDAVDRAVEGVRTAEESVRTAEEGVRTAEESVRTAEESVRTAEESVRTAEDGVRTAQDNVRTEEEGVRTEEENVTRARENVKTEQEGVDAALKRVETAQKDLDDARKKRDDLTLEADWAGKLTETKKLNAGDSLSEGTVVAVLVDDGYLRLTQWFSGGFLHEIREGQRAMISIPALMSTIEGEVEKVHENSRINPDDGASYFSVDIIMRNAGVLAAGMTASAAIETDSDRAVSPDAGELEYIRTKELKTGATGDVVESFLEDYHAVEAGELLLILDGEQVEDAITDAEKALEDRQDEVENARKRVTDAQNNVTEAQKRVDSQKRRVTDAEKAVESARKGVESAQKGVTDAQRGVETAKRGVTEAERTVETNRKAVDEALKKVEDAEKTLEKCRAVSPIDGKVVGLDLTVGEEVSSGKAAMTISDPSVISVSATVDERNMGYIKKGMSVELNQFDKISQGIVESVSLSSTLNNGVATYPMLITADNADEILQINSNIQYSLVASQNDNCLIVPVQCVHNVSNMDGESLTVVYIKSEMPPENALEDIIDSETVPEGFWPVEVKTGIQDSFNVEILSGLQEDDEVFTQMQMNYGFGMYY